MSTKVTRKITVGTDNTISTGIFAGGDCKCTEIDCRSYDCVDYLDKNLPSHLITNNKVTNLECCSACCGKDPTEGINPYVIQEFTETYGTCFNPCSLKDEQCVTISPTTGVVQVGTCRVYDEASYPYPRLLPSYFWYPNNNKSYTSYHSPEYKNPHFDSGTKVGISYEYLNDSEHKNIFHPVNVGYCHCESDLYTNSEDIYYIGSDWLWYYWPGGVIVDGDNEMTNINYLNTHMDVTLTNILYNQTHESHFSHPNTSGGQKIVPWPGYQMCENVTGRNNIVENEVKKSVKRFDSSKYKMGVNTFDVRDGIEINGIKGIIEYDTSNRDLYTTICREKGYYSYNKVTSVNKNLNKYSNIFIKSNAHNLNFINYTTIPDYLNRFKNLNDISIVKSLSCYTPKNEIIPIASHEPRRKGTCSVQVEGYVQPIANRKINITGVPSLDQEEIISCETVDNESQCNEHAECIWINGNCIESLIGDPTIFPCPASVNDPCEGVTIGGMDWCCCPLNLNGASNQFQCSPMVAVPPG